LIHGGILRQQKSLKRCFLGSLFIGDLKEEGIDCARLAVVDCIYLCPLTVWS